MRLLLDTQIAIWWQIRPASISAEVQQLVQAADAVFISHASLWEMAIKRGLGKLQIDLRLFRTHVENDGFQWLDIKPQHILGLMDLPRFDDHKDPFDRLLIAQSRHEPMTFLTADSKLARYQGTVRAV